MVDEVKIKRYATRNKEHTEVVLNEDIAELNKKYVVEDIRILKDYLNCDGIRNIEVVYLLRKEI